MKTISRLIPLVIPFLSFGQVTVQTNIPASLAPNSNMEVEVKINKGGISNFAKYQMDVPAGVTISESDSKTGNFTFDANRAKVVWVSIPSDAEFVLKFKMSTGNASGAGVFNQKFFYLEDGGKKEVEFDAVNVSFDGSGASVATSLPVSENKTSSSSSPNNSGSGNENKVTTTSTETKTEPVKTETPVASNNNSSSVPVENKIAVTEPVKTNTVATEPVTTAKTTTAEPVKTTTPTETKTEPVKTETPVTTEAVTTTAKTSSSNGMVYKVQLGAYGADPGKSKFASAGKVTVNYEGGFYKVLLGNFDSKEAAISKVNELKASGFNGFVVAYQNGVRVK